MLKDDISLKTITLLGSNHTFAMKEFGISSPRWDPINQESKLIHLIPVAMMGSGFQIPRHLDSLLQVVL